MRDSKSSADAAIQQGFAHHRGGRLLEAQRHYEAALREQPNDGRAWRLLGVLAIQAGQYERAAGLLTQATRWDPSNSSAHARLGDARQLLGQHELAIASYNRALELDPTNSNALNGRGSALHGLQRHAEAVADYDAALQLNPHFTDAVYNRGNALAAMNRPEDAILDYDRVLAADPRNAQALNNRGIAHHALKQFTLAVASYDAALRIAPHYTDAHYNRANAWLAMRRFAQAIGGYDEAIRLEPRYVQAYFNRGNAYYLLKNFDSAMGDFAKVLELEPRNALAHSNRGNVHRAQGRADSALRDYATAIALDPDCRDAWFNQGLVLHDQRQLEAALRCFDRLLARDPADAEAHFGRAAVMHERGNLAAAILSYDKAIAVRPDYTDAYVNRGNVFRDLPDLNAAMADYTKALSIAPDCTAALFNRAMVYRARKQYMEAIASLEQAAAAAMDLKWLGGAYVDLKMQICDWSGLEERIAALLRDVDQGKPVVTPQSLFPLTDSTALQRKAAQLWTRETVVPEPGLEPLKPHRQPGKKLRVGYFSADFRLHPVSMLAVELFEGTWDARFENIAFSFGPETRDALQERLARAFHRFVDVRGSSDRDIVAQARNLNIDIAVDLGGFTEYARPRIFAMRAAPLQVGFLGFTGTMALDAIDYMIADRCVIPPTSRPGYGEKIIYLPDSYMPVDTKREIASQQRPRAVFGLPAQAPVYCCFGSPHKITPQIFGVWMDILKRVDGSVLWLSAGNALARRNLHLAPPDTASSRPVSFLRKGWIHCRNIWPGTEWPTCSSIRCRTMPTAPPSTRSL